MRIAYFDCFSGISGDMTIGAFLDAGLSMDTLRRELAKLGIAGYTLKRSKVRRGAITGTKFDCVTTPGHRHSHASLRKTLSIIKKSVLSARAKAIATDIFTTIGKAEAKVHGIAPGADIMLHELGEIDSIVDIVGAAIAIDALGIDEVFSSEITMGRTVVDTHHGLLPIPGPAALALLKGVPVKIDVIDAELVTPTGAGILKTVAKGFGAMPRMKINATGYGAGARDLAGVPNMLRVIIGETVAPFREDVVTVIEANIDDMNPQHFEYLFDRLFAAGALDAYTTVIQMKKTRPAFLLTVLATPPTAEDLAAVIFRETTTIGVRFHEARRYKLDRTIVKAQTAYGRIGVKVSTGPGGIRTVTPEYDDCVRMARKHNAPLKAVTEEARQATRLAAMKA